MRPDYEDYPRPRGNYYETRHGFLTQGDIFRDVPAAERRRMCAENAAELYKLT